MFQSFDTARHIIRYTSRVVTRTLCFDLIRLSTATLTYAHRTAKPPIMTPPKAAATENMDRESQPSRPAALGELLLEEPEPPALPEPEGDEEVGLDPPAVGEGVKTPPDGSWARHEDAAEAASSAVFGPIPALMRAEGQ